MSRYIRPLDEVYDPDKSFLENKIATINNLQNFTEYCEEEIRNIWRGGRKEMKNVKYNRVLGEDEETTKAWRYTTPDPFQDCVGKMKYKIGERLSRMYRGYCVKEGDIVGYAITDENDKELKYLVQYDDAEYGDEYDILTEEELEKHFFVVKGDEK